MVDVLRKVEEVARARGASRVTRVGVRLGALSHFTPEHFREHFADASRGTLAEGAAVDAVSDGDLAAAGALDIVLESVEVEIPEPVEAR
jgi:hydrogenase nickel incorporation protein HypA/HybF